MKILFVLCMLPLLSIAQTVHLKDDKIVYEGKEKTPSAATAEVYNRIKKILPSLVDNFQIDEQSATSMKARGSMKLKAPYNIIRRVYYSIRVGAMENGYEYCIDSVFYTVQQRGEKLITKPPKEVLGEVEERGKPAEEAEKMLNETDLRFQRLLYLLKSEMNKG